MAGPIPVDADGHFAGYSSKPYVLFYTTKRVGGGVADYDAIKLLKFGVS